MTKNRLETGESRQPDSESRQNSALEQNDIRGTRRVFTSPRIRELARRFEQPEAVTHDEGLPLMPIRRPQTVRMSLGDLDWTPRRVMARETPLDLARKEIDSPVHAPGTGSRDSIPPPTTTDTPPPIYEEPPISSHCTVALVERSGRFRDGLPTLSDTTMLHTNLRHDGEKDPEYALNGFAEKTVSSMNDSSDVEDTMDASESFPMHNLSNLASYQPFPSHQIFSHHAFPFHLPHLDYHLENSDIFKAPHFSDARKLYSAEEAKLYQTMNEKDIDRHRMEICGAQLRVSTIKAHDRHQERLRRRNQRRGSDVTSTAKGVEEASTLSDEREEDAWAEEHVAEISNNRCRPSDLTNNNSSQKIPPLMLLEDNSLDELKSNAIGPRKAPGGILSYFPGLASFLGIIVDFVIGIEGSSMAAGMFRLQLLIDFVQLTRLNSPAAKVTSSDATKMEAGNSFLLVTMPSLLAFDFVSVFGYAILVFLALILLASLLLFCFWRMIHKYNPNKSLEGYRSQPWLFRPFSRDSKKGKRTQAALSKSSTKPYRSTAWSKFTNILVVTLLTILYIPLGKLSLDALVWNADYWPQGSLAGFKTNPDLYRDPSKVCYTTTMRRDEFNWAYVIVLMAASTVIVYTLWFPFAMRKAITPLLPRIPQYNELGQLRSSDELDAEYIRLLARDSSPLCFLYNAYKREWGNYKPLYLLFFKFSNIVIISVLAQDNCLWRQYQPKSMLVSREAVLIVFQSILLVAHIFILPFIDQIGNRSELVSRVGYVISSVFGLLVALKVQNYFVFNTWLLYIVYAVTYTANFYFAFASTVIVSHWSKKFQKRIDFSIDIFSPHLQLEKHIKRRVWQETFSIVLLTGDDYHMPLDQLVTFSVINENCPPVLLLFQGSPAERHIENLKIIKQVGIDAYKTSCQELKGKDAKRWKQIMKSIELQHCGPDAYWKPLKGVIPSSVTSYFGKAIWIPFPPTIVLDYDQVSEEEGHLVKISTLEEMEAFVHQNSSDLIQTRKWARSTLRAMDGQRVYCPHTSVVTHDSSLFAAKVGFAHNQYSLAKTLYYTHGVMNIKKKLTRGLHGDYLQAGFEVSITYEYAQSRDAEGASVIQKKLIVNAANAFGLSDDFDYTTLVQRFFHDNNNIIVMRLPLVHSVMGEYRHAIHAEVKAKHRIMDYSFHADIFDEPILSQSVLQHTFKKAKCTKELQDLPRRYPATMTLLLERLNVLAESDLHKWWYLFWDDLWRRNSRDYKVLRDHQEIFCPQYTTSLAWTPLSRAKLEEILQSSKGLWSDSKKKGAIFTPGLLNQIYFTMEEIAFAGRHHDPIQLGIANNHGSLYKTSASQLSPIPHSRLTGGGTDHDEVSVLNRNQWAWTEQRLGSSSNEGLWQRMRRFMALSPYTPNDNMEEVWIYARLTQGADGKSRYEAERNWNHKHGEVQ